MEPEISDYIEARTGHGLVSQHKPGAFTFPLGITLEKPISDEQAVQIAMWNNPSFQVQLSQMGIAKAQFIRSTEILNPTFMALIPVGPKQLEFAARFSLEALWNRDARINLATTEAQSIAEQTILGSMDLVRDVKLACGDLRMAIATAHSKRLLADTLSRIAELEHSRLGSGDISELEAAVAKVEAVDALQQSRQAEAAIAVKQIQLLSLMGAGNTGYTVTFAEAKSPSRIDRNLDDLLKDALAARPEVRLAELAMEAAGQQAELSKQEIYKLTGIIDANGSGSDFEIGPGFEIPLPIFNQNQGAKLLALANLESATRHYMSVRDSVLNEVRQSYTNWEAAEQSAQAWEEDLLPQLAINLKLTEKAVNSGDLAPAEALVAEQKVTAARLSYQNSVAEVYRARILLERAIGHRLDLYPSSQQTFSTSIP